MVKQYIPEEAELNPELYGLRRSHRERRGPAIVESDSEEDVAPSRKKKKVQDDYEDGISMDEDENDEFGDDDDDDDDIYYDGSFGAGKKMKSKPKTSKKQKGKNTKARKTKQSPSPPQELRFSSRNNKQVNYAIDYDEDDADLLESEPEFDEEDEEGDYYYYQQAIEPENERGIDIVMDHKLIICSKSNGQMLLIYTILGKSIKI